MLDNEKYIGDYHMWSDRNGEYIVVSRKDDKGELELVYPPNKKEIRKGITWEDKIKKAIQEININKYIECGKVINNFKLTITNDNLL